MKKEKTNVKRLKKLKKDIRGITLIALVVTIIVLLILAGIALNLTIGENGLFTRAQNAANTWQMAEQNEQNAMNSLASWIDENIPKGPEPISETESYVGYYADIEGDGTVDGVIYADLAVGNTGDGQWTDSSGNYTIPTKTNLKDYYIIQEEYTDDFETKPVLAPVKGTSEKEDRFYVMALDDFDTSTHYWYKNANGKMSDYYKTTSGDFGKGKDNTDAMIKKWISADNGGYGAQDKNDMWGLIQEKVKDGWFVPSRGEWSAFAEELKITGTNYVNCKLSDWYWSSSQLNTYSAYGAFFSNGYIISGYVYGSYYVRLSTTF